MKFFMGNQDKKIAEKVKPYVSLIEREEISMKKLAEDLGVSCFSISKCYRDLIFKRDYDVLWKGLISKGKKMLRIQPMVFILYETQFRLLDTLGKIKLIEKITEDGAEIFVEMKGVAI